MKKKKIKLMYYFKRNVNHGAVFQRNGKKVSKTQNYRDQI